MIVAICFAVGRWHVWELCFRSVLLRFLTSHCSLAQNEDEYKHVVEHMRLTNGLLFGLPVVFDTDREDIKAGQTLLLMQVCC